MLYGDCTACAVGSGRTVPATPHPIPPRPAPLHPTPPRFTPPRPAVRLDLQAQLRHAPMKCQAALINDLSPRGITMNHLADNRLTPMQEQRGCTGAAGLGPQRNATPRHAMAALVDMRMWDDTAVRTHWITHEMSGSRVTRISRDPVCVTRCAPLAFSSATRPCRTRMSRVTQGGALIAESIRCCLTTCPVAGAWALPRHPPHTARLRTPSIRNSDQIQTPAASSAARRGAGARDRPGCRAQFTLVYAELTDYHSYRLPAEWPSSTIDPNKFA